MVDNSKVAFTSQYRYEYIAVKGSAGFTVTTVFPTATATITIAHGLGYAPFFRAYYTYGNGNYFQLFAGTASYNLDGNGVQVDNTYADTSNVYVTFFNFGVNTVDGTLYYRIYAEPQV